MSDGKPSLFLISQSNPEQKYIVSKGWKLLQLPEFTWRSLPEPSSVGTQKYIGYLILDGTLASNQLYGTTDHTRGKHSLGEYSFIMHCITDHKATLQQSESSCESFFSEKSPHPGLNPHQLKLKFHEMGLNICF